MKDEDANITNEWHDIESLNWETKPEDFARLCEFIIGLLIERDRTGRNELFALTGGEQQFRAELRGLAESFKERHEANEPSEQSPLRLVTYVYFTMRHRLWGPKS